MAAPSILNTVRDLDRLRQIVAVLARHGFGEVVTRTGLGSLISARVKLDQPKLEVGERLRSVLQDLGPSFIKLGQIVSTRPDVIPPDIIRELKKLQDDVPPEPYPVIRAQVESELGASLDEIYEHFDECPIASASIGQVHRARLRSDEGEDPVDVAVKVQRPKVKDTMEKDIDLLYWFAHAVERSIPEARIYNPVKLVAEFDRAVSAELDFVLEADNAERFARNFEKLRFVKFPEVYRSASSKRVITLEFLDGKKVYDAVANGASGEAIARRSVEIIIKQIFEDGFFHADPHPGNVLIMGDADAPVIGMVDLGMVGMLTPQMRDRTIDLMVAAVREDYIGIADALYAIGRPTKKVDRRAYEAEVALLAQKYLGKKLEEIELSSMIRDLAYGARKYGVEPPPDFLMLGKALMTVEGVGKEIYPELDVFEEVKPYFLQLMAQRYSPERIGNDMLRGVARLSGVAQEAPMQVQEILEDLRKGAFRLQVHEEDLERATERLGRRLFAGLVVLGLVLGGAVLLAQDRPWFGAASYLAALVYGFSQGFLLLVGRRRRARRP